MSDPFGLGVFGEPRPPARIEETTKENRMGKALLIWLFRSIDLLMAGVTKRKTGGGGTGRGKGGDDDEEPEDLDLSEDGDGSDDGEMESGEEGEADGDGVDSDAG